MQATIDARPELIVEIGLRGKREVESDHHHVMIEDKLMRLSPEEWGEDPLIMLIDSVVGDHRGLFAATRHSDEWSSGTIQDVIATRDAPRESCHRKDGWGHKHLLPLKLRVEGGRPHILGIEHYTAHKIRHRGRMRSDESPLARA